MATRRNDRSGRARSLSRRLAMQALYQWQMTGQTFSELRHQFASEDEYAGVDPEYFIGLLRGVLDDSAALDARLGELIDRPVAQLDPVEHAVLLIGLHELQRELDVPFRVVINEGVELAKKFGATEGHKFINAVLDRAARTLRAAEQVAARAQRK
jgi:N utilization substance protein B